MKQEKYPVLKSKHVSIILVVATEQCLFFFSYTNAHLVSFCCFFKFCSFTRKGKLLYIVLAASKHSLVTLPYFLLILTHFNSLEWFNVRKEKGHIIYFISFVLELHLGLEV